MEEPLLDTESALVPFLELVEQSSSSTLRAVIQKVLAHPKIFCGFDQLKNMIAHKVDDAQLLATLDLFSYGVYIDYLQSPDRFILLNDAQKSKLRQLTVLQCTQEACKQGTSTLSYKQISNALDLEKDGPRSIEQVLISCVYARILNGKLSQKSQQFHLTFPPCCSRDVQTKQITDLINSLEDLKKRLQMADASLEKSKTFVSSRFEQQQTYWKKVEEEVNRAQSQTNNAGSGNGDNRSTVATAWASGGAVSRRSSGSRQSKRSRSFNEQNFQRY